MTNKEPTTSPASETKPVESPVAQEIPSVVADNKRRGKVFMIVFFAICLFAAYSVLTTHKNKNPDALQSKDQFDASRQGSGGPTALPPPETLPAPTQGTPGGQRVVYSATDALDDARYHSPMVLYNKPGSTPASAASAATLRTAASGAQGGAGATSPASGGAGGGTQGGGGQVDAGQQNAAPDPNAPVLVGVSQADATAATVMGDRNYMVAQGKLLDAVLETAVNSDQPGMVRALISYDIYADSGRNVLFPRGSRIIGRYDSAVIKGQARVFIVWQRVIRPDGTDIQIDSPGVDPLGRSGVEGDVNNHFFQIFGTAAVLSVIGVGTATVGVKPQDQNNSIAQYRSGVADSFNRTAGSALDQYMNIKPTITLNQGILVKIFVARDLIFSPVLVDTPHTTVIR